jgi:hypothetical protein
MTTIYVFDYAQFLEWQMFGTKVVQRVKAHILCSIAVRLSVTLYVHCLSCLLLDIKLQLYYFIFYISEICVLMMAASVQPKHVTV